MKKIISIFVTYFIVLGIIIFLATNFSESSLVNDKKIRVVATLFPQYDFVKQVGKDKVDVELLLPPGIETHTYDPSPKDIMNINESDMFVYTGDYMEPWAMNIAANLNKEVLIVDSSSSVEYINEEHHHEKEIESNHEHEADPHIWLDISNAKIMVDNIAQALIKVDSENSEYYLNNAKEYKDKLDKLDYEFEKTINNSKRNLICFGDKFSYMYFVNAYSLDYISVYDSCLAEAEPSISKVLEIEKQIEKENIPVIFYESLSEGKIAKQIAKDKGIKALVFSSVHTVSAEDIQGGATYISVMNQNLENLKIALN